MEKNNTFYKYHMSEGDASGRDASITLNAGLLMLNIKILIYWLVSHFFGGETFNQQKPLCPTGKSNNPQLGSCNAHTGNILMWYTGHLYRNTTVFYLCEWELI